MAKPVRKNVGELDVVDWGADYFGVDPSSTNIQDLINKAPDGSRIGFEEGRYLLEQPLYYSDKTLHFYARGKVELVQNYATINQPMLHAERADHSEFVGFDFVCSDTAQYYQANYANFSGGRINDYAALKITNSKDTYVSRCTSTNKLCGFAFVQCERNYHSTIHIVGFGDAIGALGLASNYHLGISYLQGKDNQSHDVTVENTGNAWLFGSSGSGIGTVFPENIKLFGPTVYNSHDNGIYISSGVCIHIHAPHIEDVNSSAIRIQADDVSVIGGVIRRAGAGVGITGLSATPIHNGIHASRNVTIIGATIDACNTGILIDDKGNSLVFTDDVKISGVLIRDSGAHSIFGTADNVNISDSRIENAGLIGIYLVGRGNIPNPKNQMIDNVTFARGNSRTILLENVIESTVTNIRDCGGNAKSVTLRNVADSDFVNIHSDSGGFEEDGASTGNLIANVSGAVANLANGSAHRQWLVEP